MFKECLIYDDVSEVIERFYRLKDAHVSIQWHAQLSSLLLSDGDVQRRFIEYSQSQ